MNVGETMPVIGFHASHELFSPHELLQLTKQAWERGFRAASCSDHFHPWSAQGQSGFAWSWLGAALESIPISFGTVCAPGQRYHPAIIAQAAATLAQMYPGRFWVALGTGQNLNEHITGDEWLPKRDRQQRLERAVQMMRRLWAGEHVSLEGSPQVSDARLYSLPTEPPRIFGAAITPETAEWCASWADGLITVGKEPDELAKTVAAFERGGGKGKPMILQAAVSFAESDEAAAEAAFKNWGVAALNLEQLENVATPEEFDKLVAARSPNDVRRSLRVSSDLGRHIAWLEGDFALGFEAVYLHHVGRDPHAFIELFGKKVLPHFAGQVKT
jgi:coenzyme F420-dependent glucose-6-phosphate dehydrogenase